MVGRRAVVGVCGGRLSGGATRRRALPVDSDVTAAAGAVVLRPLAAKYWKERRPLAWMVNE